MPTILRVDGYEIVIYLRDHLPPHVHVFTGNCEAIINPTVRKASQIFGNRSLAS